MSRGRRLSLSVALVAVATARLHAHFQVLVPSEAIVDRPGNVSLEIVFTHPMENGPAMEMAEPKQFGVIVRGGEKADLRKTMKVRKVDGKTAYAASYKVRRPGDHVFYVEPTPYWEPAEGKNIIHYTKVIVNAMGLEEGWDTMVGFPVEIEPLVRPYGLWTGNVFRGVVRHEGKPVPYAEIEVEYYNRDGSVKPPNDAFITQVIKADGNGVFAYAIPRAGWWSFAALIDGPKSKNPAGETVDTELGALIWINVVDMK